MKLNLFRKSAAVKNPYPEEDLNADNRWGDDDDGTIPENVSHLRDNIVGSRIVNAEKRMVKTKYGYREGPALVITLDNGKEVVLADTDDCCAYTDLNDFFLDPNSVDHMILGVGTTDGATTWHIYADFGDILNLDVSWSCGNPFYYGYGFDIEVREISE